MSQQLSTAALLSLVALAVGSFTAIAQADVPADGPCTSFKWDLHHEVDLFAGTPDARAAATSAADVQEFQIDHLYRLRLSAQDAVHFVVPPGKRALTDGAHAGLVGFHVERPGHYRVALSVPAWLDVVAEGTALRSVDFGGSPGCSRPHKVVEYELAAGTGYVLQLSGSAEDALDLTITAVTPGR